MIKPDIGIIVGRFQVHSFHEGHFALMREVSNRHNRVVIFLGCTQAGSNRSNPMDFVTREKLVHASFPEFTVLPLQDKKTDEAWSAELDARINDMMGGVPASITLYGSRDSFAPHYHGRYVVKELDIEVPKSLNGTDIREKLTNTILSSEDFRAGQIYAAGQRYPQCIPCVDVAILHFPNGPGHGTELLLGRKPGELLWRFVGGHAETSTGSYEEDAKKEAFEETGLNVSDPMYVGSRLVDDWRHRGTENCIKTILFTAVSMSHGGIGADDIAEVKWFNLDTLAADEFELEHRHLFEMLTKFGIKNGLFTINKIERKENVTV